MEENQENNRNTRIALGAIGIFVVLSIAGAIFYVSSKKPPIPSPLPLLNPKGSPTLYDEEVLPGLPYPQSLVPKEIINPVEALPQTNPFEKTPNPYKDAYKNPFE